jgi:hypothetical protein
VTTTVTNLVLGPATFYQGLFGATEPADNVVNVAPPTSSWTDLGGTLGGMTISIDQTYTELEVDQLVDSVGRRLTKREFMIATQLAEATLTNLSNSLNGSSATSGATLSGGTYSTLEPLFATSATQPTYAALLVDGFSPNSFRRRSIFRKSLSTAKVDQVLAKDKQTAYTVTFNGHYVSSTIAPIHVVDQLT